MREAPCDSQTGQRFVPGSGVTPLLATTEHHKAVQAWVQTCYPGPRSEPPVHQAFQLEKMFYDQNSTFYDEITRLRFSFYKDVLLDPVGYSVGEPRQVATVGCLPIPEPVTYHQEVPLIE